MDPSGYWGFRINIFGFGFEIGSDRVSVSVAGLTAGYDFQNQAAFVGIQFGLEVGPVGGSFQASVFYSFSQQQAGVSYGVAAAGQTAEARAYYDFRENQFGSSVRADSLLGNFYANTDGQRSLNLGGEDIRIKVAKAGDLSLGGPSPAALQAIEGTGWVAVGIGIAMLDSPLPGPADAVGAAVAVGGPTLTQAGGAALSLAGALQVSYAVRAPHDAYPGQTQGKITRELNKAWDSLTYGGPGKLVQLGGPPNWRRMTLSQKMIFVAGNLAKALRPFGEAIDDFYHR
ncbi:MAG: hypothetical protein A3D28_05035 [Omnitrophica bacterium RIFCSPHIGHO2_02_FULL_63_14]|nr:MAG: hypothetical protein A3D28_05035 [Omnitrophica bacterium RIFCSPHIGHO2_02_FULL_63_14]